MPERNHQLPPELPPEDPQLTAEAQKHVIKELSDKIQLLVDWLDHKGLLEDGVFTFPDGDVWKARDTKTNSS